MKSTINALFDSKNRTFEIPSYQRAYSWDEKEILQFIEDLKQAGSHYYLGHFLFEIKAENTLYVIDGQQRLTTCIIFFSAIKEELLKRESGGQSIKIDLIDIDDYYLRDSRKGIQKFKTVRDDNNFFLEEIIEGRTIHSHELDTSSKRRMKTAKELFHKEFLSTETEVLEKWYELVEGATITTFFVEDKTQAAQVFAFQNDRGKKLSKLEILKAYFMLQIYLSSSSSEVVKENISYLENEFSSIYRQIVNISLDEDEVLNYYWRATSGKGYYSEEVVASVKEELKLQNQNKISWIKGFISGLSQAFSSVRKIESSKDARIRDLRYLNNLALAYPFLIKAYKVQAPDDLINRLAQLLENITFRYLLRGGRAEIEARLNYFLIKSNSPAEIDLSIKEIVDNIKNSNWWVYWNDNSMISNLNNGYFYKNRVDNYLLWKYELSLCAEDYALPHNISYHDLIANESIEHIAPQTPTNGDPIANGYGVYVNNTNPENGITSGEWLNSIGNLLLISQKHNSSIGNKPFLVKVKSYGADNLLNQQKEILDFVKDKNNPTWDVEAIERRRDAIIQASKKIWNLDSVLN